MNLTEGNEGNEELVTHFPVKRSNSRPGLRCGAANHVL